jgi:hypothetical protein
MYFSFKKNKEIKERFENYHEGRKKVTSAMSGIILNV